MFVKGLDILAEIPYIGDVAGVFSGVISFYAPSDVDLMREHMDQVGEEITHKIEQLGQQITMQMKAVDAKLNRVLNSLHDVKAQI